MIKLHLPKQTPYIVTYEKYTNFEKHNFFMESFDFTKKFARTNSRSFDKYVYEKCVRLKTKIYELITLNWLQKNFTKQC